VDIRLGGLGTPQVARLLSEHLDEMQQHSPPESVHALDLDRLRTPDLTFCWPTSSLRPGTGGTPASASRPGRPRRSPARAMYARHGFVECAPFEPYAADPFSVFMTLDLASTRS
jgi:putative acetyltransferase